jgi:COP9 signalosome complex subunit 7
LAISLSPDNSTLASAANLPSLNERQLEKLKQLSLINLASRGTQYLTYPSLLRELELPSIRALEDLIISAVYAQLITAKLDTASQRVDVSSTAGRDVAPFEIAGMVATLNAWSNQCDDVLADIDEQMRMVQSDATEKKKEKEDYEKLLAQKKEQIKTEEKGTSVGKGKRVISEGAEDGRGGYDADQMDLDDATYGGDGQAIWAANASRRRTKGRYGGVSGNKRR